MKVLILVCMSLFLAVAQAAESSSIECMKNAQAQGKSISDAYQLCSVKSK